MPIELSEEPDLASAAAMLARRGIPVFPCVPRGKQPLTSHGFHDATADTATIQAWWGRWPDANIGMPTGAASGIDVVDVDIHPGGRGFSSFEGARAAGHADGWAWLVRTPSSGIHTYFLRTTEGEQRSWQIPSQHIDFRGDRGYIAFRGRDSRPRDSPQPFHPRLGAAERPITAARRHLGQAQRASDPARVPHCPTRHRPPVGAGSAFATRAHQGRRSWTPHHPRGDLATTATEHDGNQTEDLGL